jgi:uncharacterized protein
MSANKVIIIFVIIFLIFSALVLFQFNKKSNTFQTSQVTIHGTVFRAELAKTNEEQQIGLSKKISLLENEGMLFLFEKPRYQSFWTKGMQFPIDILFIKDNKIVSLVENASPIAENQNTPLYTADVPVDEVLEINGGLAKKYGIKIGDTVDMK